MRIFLDANAVLKRYVAEPGSDVVVRIFQAADAGRTTICYSLWTVGECLGVLDRLDRQGRMPRDGLARGRRALLGESARLARLGVLSITPLRAKLVRRSWTLLLKHHVYAADAIQVAAALHVRADVLLTSDAQVARSASAEGLRVLDPERQGPEIAGVLQE